MKYFKTFEDYAAYIEDFKDNRVYTEIEFICYNSDSSLKSETTKDNQLKLFYELKKYSNLLPYIQNWSDYNEGDNEQKSLAVVILDSSDVESLVEFIRGIASNYGIGIDIIDTISRSKLDEIINGSLENIQLS